MRLRVGLRDEVLREMRLGFDDEDENYEVLVSWYNEFEQPVCRVCEVVLKSESLWDPHEVSRKHREAISNLKANVAGLTKQNNAKPDIPKAKPERSSSSQFKRP
ncbi:hypothetical protein TSUD_246920 [Trifolium subterraneum]|uniref:C2H2-type domain-containing protein n=1 Tax=Trifolium subterraneum TaxID=3900 RepID=A0A2Z6P3X1_TRISU|nr:hypothetical protein TSUD_246920 [Trifolium subterraneum]